MFSIRGVYQCKSCVPPVSVKADGTDQRVTGHDYYDSIAIKIANATTVKTTRKKAGKVIAEDSNTVSGDGKNLTQKFTDYTGAKPASATAIYARLSAGPAGSHVISGTWELAKSDDWSDSLVTVKYSTTADGLQMQYNGQQYDANFDGKEYPVKNDPGKTTVSLKRLDAHTIEETDRRAGEVKDVTRISVAADGKTMTVEDDSPTYGTKVSYTMLKQP